MTTKLTAGFEVATVCVVVSNAEFSGVYGPPASHSCEKIGPHAAKGTDAPRRDPRPRRCTGTADDARCQMTRTSAASVRSDKPYVASAVVPAHNEATRGFQVLPTLREVAEHHGFLV